MCLTLLKTPSLPQATPATSSTLYRPWALYHSHCMHKTYNEMKCPCNSLYGKIHRLSYSLPSYAHDSLQSWGEQRVQQKDASIHLVATTGVSVLVQVYHDILVYYISTAALPVQSYHDCKRAHLPLRSCPTRVCRIVLE